MQKFVIILMLLLFPAGAFASVCTDYLSGLYSENYNENIEISPDKRERTDKYEDKINNEFISSVVYGKGYLKQKNRRRQKIMYFCTMKDSKTPVWGYVFPR